MSLLGHGHIVRDAAFSPDEKWIVTSSEDATTRIWDLSSQQMTMMFKQSGPVAKALFSPDGAHVLTAGDDGMVRLWDLANAGPRDRVLEHKGNVWKAIFSPDAKWVLTASFDHTAQLWNARGMPSKQMTMGMLSKLKDAGILAVTRQASGRRPQILMFRELVELCDGRPRVSSRASRRPS